MFQTKILYAFIIPLMRGTCPARRIVLDFFTLKMFGETYKLTKLLIMLYFPPDWATYLLEIYK
jgi:hypothetical protein